MNIKVTRKRSPLAKLFAEPPSIASNRKPTINDGEKNKL
jgi:hypothetical protein